MCDLCTRLQSDTDHARRIQDLYTKINGRLEATKKTPAGGEIAFSSSATTLFPLLTTAIFEPRMPLQLPSNFYQPLLIDGQKLRGDWASGWIRLIAFSNGSLYLLAHAFRTRETKEYLMFLHQVEFEKGEYTIAASGNKVVITVKDVKKDGIDLLTGRPASHTYSFSFTHQHTEKTMVPRNRIESSALVRSAYHGKLAQKPLSFDWTTYVVTVPHLAPHSFIHQRYKEFGYSNAMEMQNAVTELLKSHLTI